MLAALRKAYRGEAIFRPSSVDRNIACPGSAQLIAAARIAGHTRFESPYAREGSAAHIVAAEALKGVRQPDEWTDRMVALDADGLRGHFVDAEMVECVGEYVDDVRSGVSGDAELMVEQYMSLAALDPDDPVAAENRGTGDAVILDRAARRITIKDLKYGKGKMVPGDSPQLLNYAVLAALNHPIDGGWREVEVVVIQPRARDENQRRKPFTFDPGVLMMDFLGTLMQAMHASLAPDPPLRTGEHCRWCDAKEAGICPAIQAEALAVGRDSLSVPALHSAMSMMGPIPSVVHLATADASAPAAMDERTVVLPSPVAMDPADIATVLDRLPLFEAWADSIKARASRLIETGVKVPGWMMAARAGNRKWKSADENETAHRLREIGIKTVEMYTAPKLLSPAQIEKKLKSSAKPLLEPLVKRPMGQPVLMRAKEGREQVEMGMGAIEQDC